MSRGIRDLRDLICVSRLSIKESDEEDVFSDDTDIKLPKESRHLASISSDLNSKTDGQTIIVADSRVISPDSGFVTNGSPGVGSSARMVTSADSLSQEDSFVSVATNNEKEQPLQPGQARFHSQKKKKRKKSDKLPLEPTLHDLPRPPRLPPVQSAYSLPVSSDSTSEISLIDESTKGKATRKSRVNFDDMMIYLDAAIVSNWMTRANEAMEEMSAFFGKGDNFVQFAHFWLSQFPDLQKRDIFRMEYDILMDELTLAFAVGKENGNIIRRDILDLCGAIFKEYPLKLLSAKGSHIFLNYLDVLTSEKQDEYKAILSDVRCSTSNRQCAQWLLATRSFALMNVWTSVTNFFRNLSGGFKSNPIYDLWSSKEKVPIRRMLQAIRLGYIEVIHYFIVNGHVHPTHTDSHGRTLIFSAVMHNQVDVVKYFSKKGHLSIDVNLAADTGNTPLHAAANSGNLSIVEMLCQCENINLNCQNSQCENVTPLHLAVMHGHIEVVECLLKLGANPEIRSETSSAYELAKDFEHHDIELLLKNRF